MYSNYTIVVHSIIYICFLKFLTIQIIDNQLILLIRYN